VAERAGRRCEYCLSPAAFSPDPFVEEHVVPRSKGGTKHLSNLAYSCQGCNSAKYTHTEADDPRSGRTVPLYNPRIDSWSEHFAWDEDRITLVGRTPTGRATVAALDLNRESVVNLRRLLLLVGEHPVGTV
jgi:hypothetical protein